MVTKLRGTGTYKDGGSESYVDKAGKKYWYSKYIGDRGTSRYKTLYVGDINNSKAYRVKARGTFSLTQRGGGVRVIKQ